MTDAELKEVIEICHGRGVLVTLVSGPDSPVLMEIQTEQPPDKGRASFRNVDIDEGEAVGPVFHLSANEILSITKPIADDDMEEIVRKFQGQRVLVRSMFAPDLPLQCLIEGPPESGRFYYIPVLIDSGKPDGPLHGLEAAWTLSITPSLTSAELVRAVQKLLGKWVLVTLVEEPEARVLMEVQIDQLSEGDGVRFRKVDAETGDVVGPDIHLSSADVLDITEPMSDVELAQVVQQSQGERVQVRSMDNPTVQILFQVVDEQPLDPGIGAFTRVDPETGERFGPVHHLEAGCLLSVTPTMTRAELNRGIQENLGKSVFVEFSTEPMGGDSMQVLAEQPVDSNYACFKRLDAFGNAVDPVIRLAAHNLLSMTALDD